MPRFGQNILKMMPTEDKVAYGLSKNLEDSTLGGPD